MQSQEKSIIIWARTARESELIKTNFWQNQQDHTCIVWASLQQCVDHILHVRGKQNEDKWPRPASTLIGIIIDPDIIPLVWHPAEKWTQEYWDMYRAIILKNPAITSGGALFLMLDALSKELHLECSPFFGTNVPVLLMGQSDKANTCTKEVWESTGRLKRLNIITRWELKNKDETQVTVEDMVKRFCERCIPKL